MNWPLKSVLAVSNSENSSKLYGLIIHLVKLGLKYNLNFWRVTSFLGGNSLGAGAALELFSGGILPSVVNFKGFFPWR